MAKWPGIWEGSAGGDGMGVSCGKQQGERLVTSFEKYRLRS